MPTFTFYGRVHPERAWVEITTPPVTVQIGTENSLEIRWASKAGQITAKVVAAQEIPIQYVRVLLEDVVRSQVDYLSYRTGRGYDVEITAGVTVETNEQAVFGVQLEVPFVREAQHRPGTYHDGAMLAYRHTYLRLALADLREAARSAGDCAFFCYRAVESVRQYFTTAAATGRTAEWQVMRNALRIGRSWMDDIRQFSNPRRHGQPIYLSAPDYAMVVERAWSVVDRFILFLSRGEQPLPISDFPLLGHD